MELMGEYAAANHALIHAHIAQALGVAVLLDIENHHNFAWRERHRLPDGSEREVIVRRKGATPAGQGTLGVIPGSMGAPGYVVRGRGVAASLNSASHGAGRRMSRTKAKATFTWEDAQRSLRKRNVTLLSAGLDEVMSAQRLGRAPGALGAAPGQDGARGGARGGLRGRVPREPRQKHDYRDRPCAPRANPRPAGASEWRPSVARQVRRGGTFARLVPAFLWTSFRIENLGPTHEDTRGTSKETLGLERPLLPERGVAPAPASAPRSAPTYWPSAVVRVSCSRSR